ncbi:hypothetical protein LTS18_001416 [Coniosporium uncinatum]|uniref:Uncharacterized protein n=1 Tax=Coniosporium uncinatum TaxID=93489 RepID=A0ACC3DV61_9PEZI|nr:hypothetical protein LTS18_001416 [Coniosporium uncinatum]
MLFPTALAHIVAGALTLPIAFAAPYISPSDRRNGHPWNQGPSDVLKPKIVIISMFSYEADVWHGIPEFDLLEKNVTVTGFSPQYPEAHCTANGEICQVITAMGEINAAATITALVLSPLFDLQSTYFLIGGIAGVNPEVATICSVTFARYAVQVALQYEIDAREIPANFSNGYVPLGSMSPDQYPLSIYGTEVFELNANLQHQAAFFAQQATLQDSATAMAFRSNFHPDIAGTNIYAAGASAPSVVQCDSATSDTWFSGTLLSEAFGNYTRLVTNGTGNYCTTSQEDNGTLEALIRGAKAGLLDFARIIVMRTGADFDRPFPGLDPTVNLFYTETLQGAFGPSVANIYLAGIKIVEGILNNWTAMFESGVAATNYIGDILGSLGGTPDFGPGSTTGETLMSTSTAGVKGRMWPGMVEKEGNALLPRMRV